ncbi:replication factor C small subunit [Yasminevirus sp. GU-2018]|uniref:Replication factor C small subunit n=1 Tax=Yasminevirus sp. GU-2018 TaxID=2420051 RepID=A0A5K0U8D9_9VIRU|nr:replication factor C small subunit [Yasminevirus sp. GU-2018]
MPFLIDEYAPTTYESVFFHKDIYQRLKMMSSDNSIPHVILHGAPGGGKKTMISIFLKMIYGDSIDKLYTTSYNIAGSGNKTKKEIVKNSAHHIIINPTNTNFDRYLVHEIVKRYAGSRTIELTQNPNSKFKTIQISNLDRLSHSAQTSLRRMIEVNASICRFIMWCDNLSNVIDPLKSRCVCVRVPRPRPGELFAYLTYIALKKKVSPDMKTLSDIVDYSECNIKTALWCLQLYILGYDYRTNYNVAIDKMVGMIMDCDIHTIEEIRDTFFNIWITNYEGVKIVRDILRQIISSDELSEQCKANIVIRTSEIEYNILRGRREIIHFDSFVVSVMKLIQDYNKNFKKKAKPKVSTKSKQIVVK